MKNKFLKTITIISLMFCFLLTGGIFAYWASEVSGDAEAENMDITIGVGESLTTTLSLAEAQRTQGSLVPAGYETVGSVSEIVITYHVYLDADEGAIGTPATVTVSHGVLPNALLNVDIAISSSQIIAGGDMVVVTVSVTLDEPANIQEYETVANTVFYIPLTFSAII